MKIYKILATFTLLALACSATAYTPATATETRAAQTPAQVLTTESPICIVTAFETLNLRASPGTAEAVKAVLNNGDQLTILPDSPQGAWIHVRAGDLTGWINSNYCKGK